MKVGKKWRAMGMILLVIMLTVSSFALTTAILQWNVNQLAKGRANGLENDSLSRDPFPFPQELATAHIHKNNYFKVDPVVSHVVSQYLLAINPTGLPRYRTDAILRIEYAHRPF
jgi:nitrate reductase cytochrome c-type subunit